MDQGVSQPVAACGGLWRPVAACGSLITRESSSPPRTPPIIRTLGNRGPDDSMIKPGGLEPAWSDNDDENGMRMVIWRLMGDRYGDQEANG